MNIFSYFRLTWAKKTSWEKRTKGCVEVIPFLIVIPRGGESRNKCQALFHGYQWHWAALGELRLVRWGYCFPMRWLKNWSCLPGEVAGAPCLPVFKDTALGNFCWPWSSQTAGLDDLWRYLPTGLFYYKRFKSKMWEFKAKTNKIKKIKIKKKLRFSNNASLRRKWIEVDICNNIVPGLWKTHNYCLIMLKLSQAETRAQSRMKDGQCSDPGDRIENCKYLK